jgi:hypothetical protein
MSRSLGTSAESPNEGSNVIKSILEMNHNRGQSLLRQRGQRKENNSRHELEVEKFLRLHNYQDNEVRVLNSITVFDK